MSGEPGQPHTLLLGRKGSGKSALFRQMPVLASNADLPYVVLPLTPDQYAWSALKEYEEQGLAPEQAHTNAWRLTLAIEAAAALVALDRPWPSGLQPSVDKLKQFIAENFGKLEPNLLGSAKGILRGLKSFNLSAFGFGAGFDRELPDVQTLTPAVIDGLFGLVSELVTEQPLLIEFDRLDDSWDGSPESATLLIGLLKATKALNDKYAGEALAPLRTVVLLRSDIYDGLRFDDKDKHRATEEQILWTQDSLREMLANRLPEGVTADELFEDGLMRGSISPFNYIVKRTFLRPREVLQFVDRCITVSGLDATEISKDAIRDAEETYSGWKLEDLKQEYSKIRPEFDPLVEALRQEVHRYDTIDDLLAILRAKVPEVLDAIGDRGALELLFDTSVIGIRLGGTGSTRFKSEDPDLRLPTTGAVYVHQSLHKGLSIVEARRGIAAAGSDEPTDEDIAIAEDD